MGVVNSHKTGQTPNPKHVLLVFLEGRKSPSRMSRNRKNLKALRIYLEK